MKESVTLLGRRFEAAIPEKDILAAVRRMADAMGVRTGWVDAMTFGLGAGIAGVAGDPFDVVADAVRGVLVFGPYRRGQPERRIVHQLDRFLVKIMIDYPGQHDEQRLVTHVTTGMVGDSLDISRVESVLDPANILDLQHIAANQHIDEAVVNYAVELNRITRDWQGIEAGSGPRGRILKQDFEAFLARESGPAAAPTAPVKRTGTEEIKVIGLRRKIAERMAQATREIPHFSYVEEIDVTALESLRDHLNAKRPDGTDRLTPLAFIGLALVRVLRDFPQLIVYERQKLFRTGRTGIAGGLQKACDFVLRRFLGHRGKALGCARNRRPRAILPRSGRGLPIGGTGSPTGRDVY